MIPDHCVHMLDVLLQVLRAPWDFQLLLLLNSKRRSFSAASTAETWAAADRKIEVWLIW
jgi:hypothetical protein